MQRAVFGVALALVVFAGAELFTGNVMYMLQGLRARTVSMADLMAVWVASLVGNLVGSLGFAAMINAGGTLGAEAADGKPGAAQAMVASVVRQELRLRDPAVLAVGAVQRPRVPGPVDSYAWIGQKDTPVTIAPEPIPKPAIDLPLADAVR